MRADGRPLGKLIVLQEARERAAREALAGAAADEARAAEAEASAGEEATRLAEAAAVAAREGAGEQPPAEVLQFQSRFALSLRRMAVAAERRRGELTGERISAAEALERLRTDWERTRRARERFDEKQRKHLLEVERARRRREEAEADDSPSPDLGKDH